MTDMEKKIKNLENEIARLKSESELQNRLEHIKQMANKRDLSREEEINNLIHEYADLKMSIDELFDRMVNIVTVYDCLKENGYNTSVVSPIHMDDCRRGLGYFEFYSNFDSCNMYQGYVSVRLFNNEDCDLEISNLFYKIINGKDYRGYSHEWRVEHATNMLNAMKKFINNFDKFEEKFYECAENPISVN